MILETKLKSKQSLTISVVSKQIKVFLRLVDTLCKIGHLGQNLFGPP